MKKLLMSVAALFMGWSMVSAQDTYTRITSADELEDGGVYLIACEDAGWVMSGNKRGDFYRGYYEASLAGSLTTQVAATVSDDLPFAFTLESVADGNFSIKDEITNKYLGYDASASNKNNLVNVDDATAWKITFSGNNANIELASVAGRKIQVNTADNSKRFSTFTSNQTAVQLYKKEGEAVARVERPTFTPEAQVFESTISVTLACATADAKIYYSLTDEEPTTEYTAPIELSATTVITAIAKKDGLADSYKATAKYTLASDLDINTIADLWNKTGYPSNVDKDREYTVKGKVVVTAKDSKNSRLWVQDMEQENGRSVLVFLAKDKGYSDINVGDVIENLTGKLEVYFATLELIPTQMITATEHNATPYVADVTIPELIADPLKYQSALIRVENVTFVETGRFEAGSSTTGNYTLVNGNDTLIFRTDFTDANYVGSTIPTGAQTITGICATYNSLPQITARNKKDMVGEGTPSTANENGAAVKFSAYPNPTSGMLTLDVEENNYSVRVFTVAGVEVMNLKALNGKTQINLEGMAKGIYVVEIATANGTSRAKVVLR